MTEKEKELLLSWIVNESLRLDDDLVELRNRVRFRRVDVSDCVELALMLQRVEDFREFSVIVLRLLHLTDCI